MSIIRGSGPGFLVLYDYQLFPVWSDVHGPMGHHTLGSPMQGGLIRVRLDMHLSINDIYGHGSHGSCISGVHDVVGHGPISIKGVNKSYHTLIAEVNRGFAISPA